MMPFCKVEKRQRVASATIINSNKTTKMAFFNHPKRHHGSVRFQRHDMYDMYDINKVTPVLTLCWGACHPHATLTSISSVYINNSAI